MSEPYSYFEVQCANCNEEKIPMHGKSRECPNCGALLEIESWQAQHTLTAEGLLVKNSDLEKRPK